MKDRFTKTAEDLFHMWSKRRSYEPLDEDLAINLILRIRDALREESERARRLVEVDNNQTHTVRCATCGKPMEDRGADTQWCSSICCDAWDAIRRAENLANAVRHEIIENKLITSDRFVQTRKALSEYERGLK